MHTREVLFGKSEIKRALESSVISTFEEMPFIDVITLPLKDNLFYSQIMYIDFITPIDGGMALFLPYNCKKNIIENIYGRAFASLLPNEIDDCLLEIINVMAGSFLRNLCGNGIKFKVDIPKIFFDDRGLDSKNGYFTEIYFNAEGEHFKVTVVVNY